MPKTYDPIATQTASGSQATITFSSIPQTYTDLVFVFNGAGSAGNIYINLNNDTTQGNYTITRLYGDGTNPSSDRTASFLMSIGAASNRTVSIVNIMNYSNSTTFKTALFRLNPTAAYVAAEAALWRNTAAVDRLDIVSSSGNFATGSTFTLYGIKAA